MAGNTGNRTWCVVGAGPGGLAAARWLSERGIPFEGHERNVSVGGIWNIAFPGSPMYETAHFISSKTLSGFRDFPMPAAFPDYPSHRQILAYIESYADRFDLRRHFRFGSAVESAAPIRDRWRVRLASGDEREFAGIISATGVDWRPFLPPLDASAFSGDVIHSNAYKTPRQFEGRRVLVVGAGNSGCDIATDASRVASRAFLSMRRGYYVIPKHILGAPADVFARRGPHLPPWIETPVFQVLMRLLVGDLTRFGLPKPDHGILESHPILNSQVLHALSHGDLEIRGDVRALNGSRVIFVDGREEEVDLVVLATGYVRGVSFLAAEVLPDDDVSLLFANVAHRRFENLFVLGHFTADGGAYPLLDRQAELVARVIEARAAGRETRAYDAARGGPAPDLLGGYRLMNVRRNTNYVKVRPYAAYLDRLIETLDGPGP